MGVPHRSGRSEGYRVYKDRWSVYIRLHKQNRYRQATRLLSGNQWTDQQLCWRSPHLVKEALKGPCKKCQVFEIYLKK